MGWCQHCQDDCETVRDPDRGFLCCRGCGRVLDEEEYDNGPNFEKTGDGQARLSGSIVHSFQSGYSVSRERTLAKGKDEIRNIRYHLQISGEETTDNQAHLFYQIAVDKNFTRGRSTSHIAAACLYIVCRQLKKAYLLIDFTDYLQTNVYVLGAVFLQLCKMLSLDHHPLLQNLVDPSLFIHRFTIGLLNGKKNGGSSHSSEVRKVSETALRIVASMKRDWMQTGRKPSGLCGAALYISALSHGLNYSKSDIVTVVHICEATLTKRLIEFENTESSSLTIEEFCSRADELDKESYSNQLPGPGNLLCTHKDTQPQPPHFAHGLCQDCYNEFIKISGGLKDGADPPAFQRAERQRMEKEKLEEKMIQSTLDTQLCDQEHALSGDRVAEFRQNDISDTVGCESTTSKGSEGYQAADTSTFNELMGSDNTAVDEEETLSDIDDAEVDGYLHDEEEKRFKTIIWEEMNREYLEEQAAKEAAAAAGIGSETAAALAKSRRERKQKRAEDARNSNPPQTPAEATSQMLKRKGLSSRINYKALEALYKDDETTKKQKSESDGGDADSELVSTEDAVEDNDNAEGGDDENYGGDEVYDDGYYEDGDYEDGGYNFDY